MLLCSLCVEANGKKQQLDGEHTSVLFFLFSFRLGFKRAAVDVCAMQHLDY